MRKSSSRKALFEKDLREKSLFRKILHKKIEVALLGHLYYIFLLIVLGTGIEPVRAFLPTGF